MKEKKTKEHLLAVAIRYNEENDTAPKVVAKGKRKAAEKILEIAREKGVPIKEDKNLGQLLYKVDLDETVPEELYKAVAEVLAFLYFIEERQSEGRRT